MKEIKLTNSELVVLVDDEDFDRCSKYSWRLNTYNNHPRVILSDIKQEVTSPYLSRFILKTLDVSKDVDHINRNSLDNRKENLRLCSISENKMNLRKRNGTSSKYKGVSWYKKYKKWMAKSCMNNKWYFLGYWITEKDAAIAVNNFYAKHKPEFRVFNIID